MGTVTQAKPRNWQWSLRLIELKEILKPVSLSFGFREVQMELSKNSLPAVYSGL